MYEEQKTPSQIQEVYSLANDRFQGVKTYLSWTAPGRPFQKKGKQFYLSMILLVLLVEIILFLFAQYPFMVVVVALAFVTIALSSVPPSNFHYRISSQGIKVEDHFYIWEELYDFYFKHIEGMDVLIIRTQDFIPGELKISLEGVSQEHVKKILLHFLPYREYMKESFMERSADWLVKNFPLEDPKHELHS